MPIAFEGRVTDDGRKIAPGALRFDAEEPYPVMAYGVAGSYLSKIVGKATAVHREDDGTITAVISSPIVGLAPQIEVDDADFDYDTDGCSMLITSARLRAVTLGESPVWDGLVITESCVDTTAHDAHDACPGRRAATTTMIGRGR